MNVVDPLTLFGEEGSFLLYFFRLSPMYYPTASHYNTPEILMFPYELILALLQGSLKPPLALLPSHPHPLWLLSMAPPLQAGVVNHRDVIRLS